jgi:hypothetical protein
VNGRGPWGSCPVVSNGHVRESTEPPPPGQPRTRARRTGSDYALEE